MPCQEETERELNMQIEGRRCCTVQSVASAGDASYSSGIYAATDRYCDRDASDHDSSHAGLSSAYRGRARVLGYRMLCPSLSD